VLYLDRPFETVGDGTVLLGAVRIQRLEGNRFPEGLWFMGVVCFEVLEASIGRVVLVF
jgi:hypothetical protein